MSRWTRTLTAIGLLLCVSPALAAFHLWKIVEVYSSEDASVQFIELVGEADSQHFLSGHTVVATSDGVERTFTFPSDLPDSATNNRRMLLATPGFADLPGGVAPDYEIPVGFFDPGAGTIHLNFAEGSDEFQFSCGDLPVGRKLSLLDTLLTAINSPENFAGSSGSVFPGTILFDRFSNGCNIQ